MVERDHRCFVRSGSAKGSEGPGSTLIPKRTSGKPSTHIPKAAEQKAYDDASVFGDLLETHEVLFDFPATGWVFRADPEDKGIREEWPLAAPSTAEWSPIEIKRFWEEQGWDHDGVAWYRTEFIVPSVPKGKSLQLVVGAADESATVWIDGEKVGTFDIGEAGWDKRFSFDMTGRIEAGKKTPIAFRVLDRTGVGGLWKSIKITAAK